MTVYDFFENFDDKNGVVIRIVANDGNFNTIIGYKHIDTNGSMWRNFISMYGDYLVTEWYVDMQDFLTLHVEENKGEGKFDYAISYNVKAWDEELGEYRIVHKSQLAHAIEHAFEWGGYNMKISCVERKES